MKRIALGMIGGGEGAFIGEVHRMAARLDDRYELVAGALSSDPQRARQSAQALGITSERSYGDFREMARAEAARADGIEVAVVVTPNHLHFEVAKAMLEAGIHVVCDKPLSTSLATAEQLRGLVSRTGRLFMVTYNYSGYPLVRQAREMVQSGDLGKLRLVQVEYPQDWLATDIESSGMKQAAWRTDPDQAGPGGSIGDIGTHAFHLAEFVSGQQVKELLADLHSFVDGRKLDDNAHILLRFDGGARGMLWASQVACGHENGLRIRVYGDKGSLQWFQEEPNRLVFTPLGQTPQIITRAGGSVGEASTLASRLPAGHPEGFIEAFANLYGDFAGLVAAARGGEQVDMSRSLLPLVSDGVNGLRFIEAAVVSSKAGGVWQSLDQSG